MNNCLIFATQNYIVVSGFGTVGFLIGGGSSGGTAPGSANGTGTSATFNSPSQITIDSSGNLFLADATNNLIRKIIISSATSTTLAGSTQGYLDSTGTLSKFNNPNGICYDGSGNLFIGDTNNSVVRKVVIGTGVTTTLAGGGTSSNGTGTNAQFYKLSNSVYDGSGNIFIADTSNNMIRQVVISTGAVTTLAGRLTSGSGNGIGTNASFNNPLGITYDGLGNLFVADSSNNLIRMIVIATATVSTFAGGQGGTTNGLLSGVGTNATFNNPSSMTIDTSGNIFLADTGNSLIRKINLSTATVTTIAGGGYSSGVQFGFLNGTGTNALFNFPMQQTTDGSGNLYICDYNNNSIRKLVIATNVVSTFAGGIQGLLDGVGTNAKFYNPSGILFLNGILYVSDSRNNCIRQIDTTTAAVVTVVGSATSGYLNGVGTNAQLSYPEQMTMASDGNLYFIDKSNCMIRRIVLSTFTVTTFVGQLPGNYTISSGSQGGFGYYPGAVWHLPDSTLIGTNAYLYFPDGICADTVGNIYYSQSSRDSPYADGGTDEPSRSCSIVCKAVLSTGEVSKVNGNTGTYTGNSSTLDPLYLGINCRWAYSSGGGSFYQPKSLVYYNGVVYVGNATGAYINKATGTGGEVGFLVDGDNFKGQTSCVDGVGGNVRLYYTNGMCSDNSGTLYISDSKNHVIRKLVLSTSTVTTIAGGGLQTSSQSGFYNAQGLTALFNSPSGIGIDTVNSILYVADTNNSLVRKIQISNSNVTTFAGGTNYNVNNNPPVTIVTGFANLTGTNATFNSPKGIVWDGSGNLFVADTSNNAIRKIVISTAAVTTFAGSPTPGSTNGTGVSARFYNPLGISVDTLGNFYICDTNNNLLRKITSSAVVTTLAGGGVSSGSTNGTGVAATFNSLKGVCYDGSGNLFLCDTANNLIRKIVISTAVVTTLAGSITPGSANGTGTNASFNGPIGVTRDISGNLYIVDTGNNMIRKIVISSGVVSTVAGSTTPGSTDAIGTNASFNGPDCACTDTSGNLYVSDTGNNRIRKIALSSTTVTTLAGSTQGYVNGNGVSAQFNQPVGLIMNSSSSAMYVSDAGNNVIRIIT